MEALPVVFMLLFGLICVGMAVLFPLAIVNAHKRAVERRQGIAGFAHHREWEYRPEDSSLVDRFGGAPFGRGRGRSATNVLVGRYDGRPFTAFDYHYVDTRGEHSHTYVYSVVALNLGVPAPDLSIGPTTTMRRWVDSFTGRDIEIGDPAFDAHFTVHSPAPEFAVDVLRSDVREVMQHHPELSWRISGDSLLMIRPGAHPPAEVEAKLHIMDAILDRIPATVWDRLRGEQPR